MLEDSKVCNRSVKASVVAARLLRTSAAVMRAILNKDSIKKDEKCRIEVYLTELEASAAELEASKDDLESLRLKLRPTDADVAWSKGTKEAMADYNPTPGVPRG